ncbi:DUF2975 domain-containing protein [Polaribacter marinivivus]|uniref:DUF2975 domain-containing protein n=1 Tax=Polaribacter marinivivus TaxID=1524260 RepID=A0ABV8R8K0_9FLAO
MKSKNILKIMYVFAWLAFIGLCIQTGAIIFSYLVSLNNPEASKNLFGGLNLSEYYNYNINQYSIIVFYKVLLYALEAYIAFILIKLLKDLDIKNPFNQFVSDLMKNTSISIFVLWIIAMIHNTHLQFIGKKQGFEMDLFSSDFVFLAGVIFIFTKIVQRGIQIQTENDLTI